MTTRNPIFTKFFNDARAVAVQLEIVSRLEEAATRTATKTRAAAAAASKTATKLGQKMIELETEFVKLGDGVINYPEPDPITMELMIEQRMRRNAILQQQRELERHARNRQAEAQRQKAIEDAVEDSRRRCLQIIERHLVCFLESHPDASFEDWIAALHPENTTCCGDTVEIDERFFIPGNVWYAAFQEATASRKVTAVSQEDPQRVLSC